MQPEHLERHEQLIRALARRHHLPLSFQARLIRRTPEGCAHHGEYNHHRPEFRPLHQARDEVSDAIDLACVHTRERVALGIAEPLPPEKRQAFAAMEMHLCLAARHLETLLEGLV